MLKKGCFGSVIAFAPDNEVCSACEHYKTCSVAVFGAEPAVVARIERLEAKRQVEDPRAPRIARFFKRRQKLYHNPPQREEEKKAVPAVVPSPVDYNVIQSGANPYPKSDRLHHVAAGFLMEVRYATLKDFAEHFHEIGDPSSKTEQTKAVRQVLKALMTAQLVSKQGSLFCLH